MRRTTFLALALVAAGAAAAPVPKEAPRPKGVVVFDDSDPVYKDKSEYHDKLTVFDADGKVVFQKSGFNNCDTIGSSRAVTVDGGRKCLWVVETVANRVRRFSLDGKETLDIPNVKGSALAVDADTGNVWVAAGLGAIGKGHLAVYDDQGRETATYPIPCWDIAYDRSAKAFWTVERNVTKISAATGKVVFSVPVAQWCAISVDVDRRDGSAWVGVRAHGKPAGGLDINGLVKFDANGREVARVDLGEYGPRRVSVDPTNGCVWTACGGAVRKYSADGKLQSEYPFSARSLQADPAGGDVWVATSTELLRLTAKGDVAVRTKHDSGTSQVWMAALE